MARSYVKMNLTKAKMSTSAAMGIIKIGLEDLAFNESFLLSKQLVKTSHDGQLYTMAQSYIKMNLTKAQMLTSAATEIVANGLSI